MSVMLLGQPENSTPDGIFLRCHLAHRAGVYCEDPRREGEHFVQIARVEHHSRSRIACCTQPLVHAGCCPDVESAGRVLGYDEWRLSIELSCENEPLLVSS